MDHERGGLPGDATRPALARSGGLLAAAGPSGLAGCAALLLQGPSPSVASWPACLPLELALLLLQRRLWASEPLLLAFSSFCSAVASSYFFVYAALGVATGSRLFAIRSGPL